MQPPSYASVVRLLPLIFACVAAPGQAEIAMRLRPVADTALRESQPNDNFGAVSSLVVGVSANGSPRNRVLVRFDLSPLPADAVLTSAKLRLTVTQAGPTSPPTPFELRRVLADWGEGNKPGLAATIGEATWMARFNQQFLWASGGGLQGVDFSTNASAVASLGAAGDVAEFGSAGIIADLNRWRTNAAANFGWVMLAQNEPPGSGKQVGSRENSGSAPVLELTYRSFSIYDCHRIAAGLRFSFDVNSNQTYAVEYRDTLSSGVWTTLTNIPSLGVNSTIHLTNQIGTATRFFRLRQP